MESERFIYKNSVDAFSYLFVFLISVYTPTIISLAIEESIFMLVIFFANSVSILREYLLLIQYKKVGKRFWLERFCGIVISIIIALYSIIALICYVNEVAYEVLEILNILCAVLFFCPCVISAMEGILYIVHDYKENAIEEQFVVAEKTAADV